MPQPHEVMRGAGGLCQKVGSALSNMSQTNGAQLGLEWAGRHACVLQASACTHWRTGSRALGDVRKSTPFAGALPHDSERAGSFRVGQRGAAALGVAWGVGTRKVFGGDIGGVFGVGVEVWSGVRRASIAAARSVGVEGQQAMFAERHTVIDEPANNVNSATKVRPVQDCRVARVEATPVGLHVHWESGDMCTYHYEWLHRNRPETHLACGQNTQSPCLTIPTDTHLSQASLTADRSAVRLVWGAGHDVSVFKTAWLREYDYSQQALGAKRRQRSAAFAKSVGSVRYDDIIRSDVHVREWLEILNRDGLCVVKDVPIEEDMVQKVGRRIGGIMPTIYGLQWDVRTVAQPINCAYTNHGLALHQDLAYYESPPGIQLLHCLRFDESITGGLSTFADGFQVAQRLRERDPAAFDTLTRVPATFQKIHYDRPDPVHIEYRRPHIGVNTQGDVINVFWSPAFEGPLEAPADLVPAYYRAYKQFADIATEDGVQIQFRLRPGELVSFSNRRMLHGRTAFSEKEGAVRHLQGCYITIESYINRLRVLQNGDEDRSVKRLSGVQITRVCNGDFS